MPILSSIYKPSQVRALEQATGLQARIINGNPVLLPARGAA